MDVYSRLVPTRTPARPEAVALVLHGGASRGQAMRVSPTQLSVLRMVPIAGRLAQGGRGRLAVFRLLNSARGWDTHTTPVDDVRWALAQVQERYGADVPVGLVGHSLGGRAALLSAAAPQVRAVVALAAWLHPHEAVPAAPGRDVLFVHGDADRIASLSNARAAARRLSSSARVGFVTVGEGKHAMLRRHRVFDGLAADWVRATLLGDSVGDPLDRLRGGEQLLQV